MNRKRLSILILLGAGLASTLSSALVTSMSEGMWPTTWPEALEDLRAQAATYDVMHGVQETVYEIPFKNREDFEKAWPHILTLKSPGANLILERSPSTYGVSGTSSGAGVRILAPLDGRVASPATTPPEPNALPLPLGALAQLPEYDVKELPTREGRSVFTFKRRARVDIVLIVDGTIVDLNRLPLPAGTPIVDHRFYTGSPCWPAATCDRPTGA